MKPEVMVIGPMPRPLSERLERDYAVHRYAELRDDPATLSELGPRIRAVVTDGHRGCPAEVMEALPRLELIASYGVGYDSIDVESARARGVRVTNTPDVLNDAVAELAIGLMIALCRRIVDADRYVREGRWPGGSYGLTGELTGRTVGILGLGRIGKEIARRAQAMRMQVLYHGRTRQPDQPYPYYAGLAEMAGASDWLVLAAPGSIESRGIVDERVLEALGPDGNLVNIARGSLVDEPALVRMLCSGGIAGAALDVFEDEPHVPEALRDLPNVVLSPHQASATEKTRKAMGDLVLRNLAAHFAGRPLISPVA